VGGVEEPIADVDIVVEVVEVLIVTVVDFLHDGDCLAAVKWWVAIGLHRQRAGSRVRV
jgi:hypothetical protein